MTKAALLWPRPKEARPTGEGLRLPAAPRIELPSANPLFRPSAERLAAALRGAGARPIVADGAAESAAGAAGEAGFRLALAPERASGPEGYRLAVGAAGVEVAGFDEAGLFHGVSTFVQWLRLHEAGAGGVLPGLEVLDRPDFRHRGLLLDVSRDRVPTTRSLYALVDLLASLKLNQLQLYTEHAFAYRGHEAVWRDASPLTATEVRDLDLYCRARGIELVPNQNSFGHMHRWLAHEPYRRLAECPEGIEHPFSDRSEPFSLCPVDPASLELLADLYDQLLPQFSSRQANVGLDETFDLGRGRSAEACRERGVETVYLEFLWKIHGLLAERGRRMQFWADIAAAHPQIVERLPKDAVALEWGYEAGHPFAERCRRLAAAGLDFYVCPGTSSWNSLAGRARNALANLAAAARAGAETGAAGYLVTDWGDHGHLQPPPASWPGIVAGAGFAWNAGSAAESPALDLAALLDRHVCEPAGEPPLGAAVLELASAYLPTAEGARNGSALFYLLLFAAEDLTAPRFAGVSAQSLEETLEILDRADGLLASARTGPSAGPSARELDWVSSLLRFACRLGRARLERGRDQPLAALPRRARKALRRELDPLIDEHRRLWLARSRPGGLEDSTRRLTRVRDLLT